MSLTFEELWKNFPSESDKTVVRARCQNKQPTSTSPFKNYCAIYLSEALIKSGVPTASANVSKCWSHPGVKNILRAEEMAGWLKNSGFSWLGKLERIDPKTFQDDLEDRTGIIFFKDYWQRGKESFENRSGDHIDLWNKDELTGGGMLSRNIYELLGILSDLNKSREIWFWEVE